MRILAFILVLLLPTAMASAQSGSYNKWQNPDRTAESDAKLQTFTDKLNTLIDKAEKAQAASPQFLRDLRDLARGYDRPWRHVVLNDTFRDGNFTADPVWQVSVGEYWIEQGWGLRTSVDPSAKAAAQPETKRLSGEDAAAALFGSILNQAIGGKKKKHQPPQPKVPSEAAIHSNVNISNAFALSMNMSTWTTKGRIEFAIFQGKFSGSSASPGYRLVYQPEGRLELHRVTSRGRSIIDSTNKIPSLTDKKFHDLNWVRHADGRMAVSIDGTTLLKAPDRGFRDTFSGLAIINSGGDYIFKSIRVDGV